MSLHIIEGVAVRPEHRGAAQILIASNNVDEVARLLADAEARGRDMTSVATGDECRACGSSDVSWVRPGVLGCMEPGCKATWAP